MNKKDLNNHNLPDELKECLKEIVTFAEREDSFVRKQQLKTWKKADEFWHGIQYVFWSEIRQDWMTPQTNSWFSENEGREDASGPFYDYVINIYRAHGESIIAALAAQVPEVRFPPDDIDNEDDIMTSKTFDKISDLIGRHNKEPLLMLKALLFLWNQGIVFAYHPPKADKVFGTVHIPNYKKSLTCPNCQSDKPAEDEEDLIENFPCPSCGTPMEVTTVLDSISESPKSRTLIKMWGPLNVKVSYYAAEQANCGYLIHTVDEMKAFMKHEYPHIADKIDADISSYESFERISRTPSPYNSNTRTDDSSNLVAHRKIWLRPWMFEVLGENKKAEKEKLKKMFPNGCYVSFVNDVYAESRDEDLDKYWTVGNASLSRFIHSDSLGNTLVSPQEMRNVLTNLTLDTIEHAIPAAFADTETVDFDTYSKHEARPGMLYPAKRKPGENLSQSFYEQGRATVSKEVGTFAAQLDKDGQLVSGAFPSIYGGTTGGSSRTAQEYNMSRQMALQRLSIAWKLMNQFWAEMKSKCVHIYVENMLGDEKYTKMQNNSYETIWIKKAETTGHVGEVEAEGADTFPVSTAQKQALLMQLLQLNNPMINEALFDSENRKIIADSMAFPELSIPGEDQRIKQARETQEMSLKLIPLEPDPDIDDHQIHINSLKKFLVGAAGWELQRTNPQAFQLCKDHLMKHVQILTMQTMQQHGASGPGQAPGGVQ
jgi:hypothetical protein